MNNTPKLRFKEFENEWNISCLEDKGRFFKGSVLSKSHLSDSGRPCILYGQLYTSYGEVVNKVYSKTDLEQKNLTIGNINDVLIPSSGETAIDIATATCLQVDNVLLGGDLNIFRSKELNGVFLSYQLNSSKKRDMARLAQGASVVHLYNDSLKKIKINYPSLSEQEKIASFLSLFDEKIELQEKKIKSLEKYKKGMMQKIFSQEIRFKDENGENYPEWEEKKFKDIYSKASEGGTPPTKIEEYYINGDIPFVKIEDLKQKYIINVESKITELGLKKSSAWIVPADSVIFSNGATIGEISINKYPVCTKQGILGIIPNNDMYFEFLYYAMQTNNFTKNIKKVTTKGTMSTAYLKDIDSIKIKVPSLSEQQKISNFLSTIDSKIELEQKKLDKLKEYKKGLLQQMFV